MKTQFICLKRCQGFVKNAVEKVNWLVLFSVNVLSNLQGGSPCVALNPSWRSSAELTKIFGSDLFKT